MKFVYFGYDFMLPAILALIEDGHELMGVFSFECDNVFNFNTASQELAQRLGAPFIPSKAEDYHLESLIEKGCECFLAAGYPFKIPPIDETKSYAVNIHPAYLPYGRGIMPVPHIILKQDQIAAGLTAHKMTQIFDGGDILLQEKIELSPQETPETYMAKILIRAPAMLKTLMSDLPALWGKAKPQDPDKASAYPPPTDEDRLLNWNESVEDIDRRARAFGRFGSIATIDDVQYYVYSHKVWKEKHAFIPGTVAAHTQREITIAAKDGFICLIELYSV